jgi:fumarylacetoacetase
MLELASGGQDPVQLPNGETRAFVEDGDEILLRAAADAPGFVSIGLGESRAAVLPA